MSDSASDQEGGRGPEGPAEPQGQEQVPHVVAEGLCAVELIASTEGVVAENVQRREGESAVEDRVDAETGQEDCQDNQTAWDR